MAKKLKILTKKSPILRLKAKTIPFNDIIDPKMTVFCRDFIRTMVENDGAGLAAPQVGKSVRLIAVSAKDGVIVMFNPEILKKSWACEWGDEGCLSVPGVFGKVKRHKKISFRYFDSEGKKIKDKAEGLFARVIQHEVDHLNGILFTDKAKELTIESEK